MQIGVYGSAPFVKEAASLKSQRAAARKGISVDLWLEIARRQSLQFELVAAPNIEAGLQSVAQGELDLLIGPISVTRQRAETVDFTHPYYEANIGILSRSATPRLMDILRQFMQAGFPIALALLVITLFTIGTLFWLVEHKHNPNLSDQFWPGVGKSMWFAMVTFVTVGYGEITPRTFTGRLLTGGWMLMSLLIASSITAVMATTFTLQGIKTATVENRKDLEYRPVGVVRGTTGASFARSSQAILIESRDLPTAVKRLQRGEVLAVTHDFPILNYHLQTHPATDLKLFESYEQSETYAFALRKNHPLRRRVNLALLAILESPEWSRILKRHGL